MTMSRPPCSSASADTKSPVLDDAQASTEASCVENEKGYLPEAKARRHSARTPLCTLVDCMACTRKQAGEGSKALPALHRPCFWNHCIRRPSLCCACRVFRDLHCLCLQLGQHSLHVCAPSSFAHARARTRCRRGRCRRSSGLAGHALVVSLVCWAACYHGLCGLFRCPSVPAG